MMNNEKRFRKAAAQGTGRGQNRPEKKYTLLNAAIIALSVILALSVLFTIRSFKEAAPIYYDSENTLYYSLSDKNYDSLAKRYNDTAIGREEDAKVKKVARYYAVGRYFEKAFFANAYEKAGMTEEAEMYHAQMEAIEPYMEEFAAEKENILALFR